MDHPVRTHFSPLWQEYLAHPGICAALYISDQAEPCQRAGSGWRNGHHGAYAASNTIKHNRGNRRTGQGHPGQHDDHRHGFPYHHRRAWDQPVREHRVLLGKDINNLFCWNWVIAFLGKRSNARKLTVGLVCGFTSCSLAR